MNIRFKALSLALFSLVWATQAQASWSGSSCNGNNNGVDCTITGSASGPVSGSGGLTIQSGASLTLTTSGNTVNASGNFTITNNGSITASSSATHAIQVSGNASGSISNTSEHSITGNWNGISIETGTSGSGTIAVNNTGTITGTQGRGIYVNGSGTTVKITNSGTLQGNPENNNGAGIGLHVASATSGSTIESTGVISGYVGIKTEAHIDSISINSGSVSGAGKGILLTSGVGTLTIASGATVSSSLTNQSGFTNQQWDAAAIELQGNVTTFTNNGTISGLNGVKLVYTTKVDTFTNSGVIESTGDKSWNAAVNLLNLNYQNVDITNFSNGKDAVIRAPNATAIAIEVRNNIEVFKNEGTIQAGYDGIQFFNADWDSKPIGSGGKIGKIELASGSSIEAGRIAINIEPQTASGSKLSAIEVGDISIDSNAQLKAGSYGIVLGQSATMYGSIAVNGTVQTGNSVIYNKGIIDAQGTPGTAITINSENITHASGSTIENPGTINGNIVVESGVSDFSFANPGILNGKLIIKGTNTKVDINDWNMKVVADEVTGQSKVEGVTIDTPSAGNITINHVSINDLSSSLLGKNISFDGAFQTSSGQTIDLANSSDAVKIGELPSNLGFDGTYDPNTKTFYTSFNIAQTAGAVVSQTLANQLMRRDFFLEAAVTEAATGSLYHRKLDGVEGTAFVKPYASSDSFDLDGAKMDGHTQGVMMGLNRFVGRHILTGFVGFERSEIDSDFRSSMMNLDVQTWYGGFNTAHLLQAGQLVDTFLKGSLKASYTTTGIDRSITLNANTTGSDNTVGSNMSVINSSAKPNTVAVGMNVQLGMNFKPMKETQIIPMVGLGYSIGKTSSYQLDRTGLINDAYMPERVMMPYADASVTWFQGWGKIVRTFVGGGMRYILDRTQKTALSYGKLPIEGEYSLPQSFQYVNASMVLHITHHSEIAVGYTGVFDSTGHSQNLTTKYELHF